MPPRSAPLPIDVEAIGDDLVVVAVHVDIDLTEAGELRAVLNDACTGPHRSVVVDLDGVHFVGTSAMGVLAEVHQRMAEADRRLIVLDAADPVRSAFEMAGIAHLLEG